MLCSRVRERGKKVHVQSLNLCSNVQTSVAALFSNEYQSLEQFVYSFRFPFTLFSSDPPSSESG